jgi:hypothetical protein
MGLFLFLSLYGTPAPTSRSFICTGDKVITCPYDSSKDRVVQENACWAKLVKTTGCREILDGNK